MATCWWRSFSNPRPWPNCGGGSGGPSCANSCPTVSLTDFSGDGPVDRWLSRIHAVEEHDRKILRQDLQDLQVGKEDVASAIIPHRLGRVPCADLYPVHPVHPVKIQFFNCIVPA